MMNAVENLVEAPGDFVEVFQGQLAIVQLSVGKDFIDEVLDKPLNP